MARARPVRTRSMRFTLTALLVVPLVSLLALWAFGASVTVGSALRDRNYNHLVSTGAKFYDALETQLAQERLQTFIWLSTDRRAPAAALDAARKQTDAVLVQYHQNQEATRGNSPASLETAGNVLGAQLAQLPGIRTGVDSGALSPAAAFTAYSNLVDAEFALFQATGSIGLNLAVFAQTDASIQAARALEYLGREATLMAGAAVAQGQMSTGDRELFASAVTSQRLLISDAINGLTPASRGPFQRLYASPAYQQLAAMENQVSASVGSKGPVPVNLQTWAEVSTGFLRNLEGAQLGLNAPLAQVANQYGNRLLLEAYLAGGLGLLAVVASILITAWFGRRLTGGLTDLHRSVQSMADERLPSVVERLRRGDEVDAAAESPPPVPAKITEIVKVADAFATVQRTAVEAAVGQANLRKGVNQVFLNLSLRNQSLLHRQLTMLDTMERAARNPQALDELFRLDHLTTRMRRHAEGLIILAGSTPARGWRDPVPVVDVLRAAIAEVEDYVRIDVTSESRDAVAGTAVNDMIHLIAELAENATAFSPPHTRVEIKADAVANGLAVEIEDRGLGLSDEEMAEINEQLASPPEFDLANSDQLGLFVVGQLAARHGIRVALRSSPYGGTIAIVLMPLSIVVRDGESQALAGPAGLLGHGGGPAAIGPAAVSPAAGPLPEQPAALGSEASASVFSLTGRHRLAAALSAGAAATDPWPAVTPAAPAAPAVRGPAARPQAPWEQESWEPAPWTDSPWPESPWAGPAAAPAPAGPPLPGVARPPAPAADGTAATHLGMPVRVRQASLAPQLRSGPDARGPVAKAPGGPAARSPEQARSLMAALQRGWEHGRTDDLEDPAGAPGWPRGGPDDGGTR